jgi:hypothetical protein
MSQETKDLTRNFMVRYIENRYISKPFETHFACKKKEKKQNTPTPINFLFRKISNHSLGFLS